jgi:hypothetical protein
MDPYLESATAFSGLHSLLVTYTVEQLQPQLLERGYYIAPNERIWIEEAHRDVLPDGAVLHWKSAPPTGGVSTLESDHSVKLQAFTSEHRQPYLEIFDKEHHRLVTGIEYISPTNKINSEGRRLYRKKQRELQRAGVNLVEIDLLRSGRNIARIPPALLAQLPPHDYLACLWRAHEPEAYDSYPIPLRSSLPRIRIPLEPRISEPVLDLQSVFTRAYDAGPYCVSINYAAAPAVRIAPEDAQWCAELLGRLPT